MIGESTMTFDELKEQLLVLMPEAIFDTEYRSGELMISTGLYVNSDGVLESLEIDDVF